MAYRGDIQILGDIGKLGENYQVSTAINTGPEHKIFITVRITFCRKIPSILEELHYSQVSDSNKASAFGLNLLNVLEAMSTREAEGK